MSSVVLDASAPSSLDPAVYAETLVCGGGGVICGTDPTIGLKVSRQYGPLGATTELLAQVTKDLALPPNTPNVPYGGVVNCAGLRVSTALGTPSNGTAGTPLLTSCGQSTMTNGVCQVYCSAVQNSANDTSVVLFSGFDPTGGASGSLRLSAITNTGFTVTSYVGTSNAVATTDQCKIFWMIVNPNWNVA